MTAPQTQVELVHATEMDPVARAKELYHAGQFNEAAELLSDAIAQRPGAELWNDWAAMQISLGEFTDAESGFRLALQQDQEFGLATENLGALLFAQGRFAEAAPLLEQALTKAAAENRAAIETMLARCGQAAVDSDPIAGPDTVVVPADTQPAVKSQQVAMARQVVVKSPSPEKRTYDEWFASTFQQRVPAPNVRIATSWPEDSPWGRRAFLALVQLECDYVTELLTELRDKNVEGDIAEFGIFEGWWVGLLWEKTEQLGMPRRVYGFDSFAGLSEPHPEHDQAFWKKGQYACSYEQVAKNVQLAARPRIRLVKGYFEQSLHGAAAQVAGKIAYARIDCDIYEPALDCLRYLAPRLADGAILVFDDWPHVRGYGEQRAFEEWLPTVPNLEFEFLFYGVIGHFYTRVHYKK
jgi:tetratricopeptide (TPR) repeat protein